MKEILVGADYADGKLTSRLKARQTTLDVMDLSESIKGTVERYRLGDMINLRSLVMKNCAKEVLKIIATKLSPDKFELLIQDYFYRLGADAKILPKNSEDKKGDIDVHCRIRGAENNYLRSGQASRNG